MQTILNLKEIYFSDCKNIIQKLIETESIESLIAEQNNIYQLLEKISFLKSIDSINEKISAELHSDLDKNRDEKALEEKYIQQLKEEYWRTLEEKENKIAKLEFQIKSLTENQISETNDKNDFEIVQTKQPIENLFVSKENINTEEIDEKLTDNLLEEIDETVAEKTEIFENSKPETASEKKFRLGKIKGLTTVKSLFDEDSDLNETALEKKTPLQNRNMPTDFMEAEKEKLDFRIDLNDKVAFTKLLFNGDEENLKATINKLNSYKSLDEAKEYLSELYYKNNWQKVDDYAQRLWILVENKFI